MNIHSCYRKTCSEKGENLNVISKSKTAEKQEAGVIKHG